MICIQLNKVTPSVERSGHRDAQSPSSSIMIAKQTEAMCGHFFMVWFARPPRAIKQCSSPLCAFDGSMLFESRGSRQALSEVEGRVVFGGTMIFKPTSVRKALQLPNWNQQEVWTRQPDFQVGQVRPTTQYQRTQVQVTDAPKLVNGMPTGLEKTSQDSTTKRMRRQ